jgi:hypothetical protein
MVGVGDTAFVGLGSHHGKVLVVKTVEVEVTVIVTAAVSGISYQAGPSFVA